MMSRKLLFPLLFLVAACAPGCRTSPPLTGAGATAQAREFAFWSPHLLLTGESPHRRLEVEIDHVQGAGPTAKEIASLKEFLEAHCRKPDGVHLRIDDAISRDDARGKSRKALAETHLDGPVQRDSAFAYFLFHDSRLAGTKPQNPETTRIPYPAAVFVDRRFTKRWSWFPGAGDAVRRMIIHEAGHLLGLCINQSHGDGLHCTNESCLMNHTLYFRPARLVLPGAVLLQRDFCADCRADLSGHGGMPAAGNLRFIGLYCVRTEPAYHVVSSPGFVYVHVGALDELDLADLDRRRRAKFQSHPDHNGWFYETGQLDLETARALVPLLEGDPLELIRILAAELKQKLPDTEP